MTCPPPSPACCASPSISTRSRGYENVGTEGFNRMWSQMAPDDPVIDLPIYQGRIDPTSWQPRGV